MGQPYSPLHPARNRRAGSIRRRLTTAGAAATAALALSAGLTATGPQASAAGPTTAKPQTSVEGTTATGQHASAAGPTQVTGFGSNPGNLSMYTHVPDGLPAGAPLVVALHGCTQSASDYHAKSGWPRIADRDGFALVFPQTTGANNANSCFNWFDPADSARDRGEALSIRQMVGKAAALYGSDTGRVYITGLSAGGGMTANMLAAYPDVFAGGAVASGLPASCATTLTAAYTCMYSPPDRTPAQWGALVRSAAPAGTSSWPRVAIWQGTADTTVAPANAAELRDQWTDVWGAGQTPSRTATLGGGTTLDEYDDPSGRPAVRVHTVAGMAHGLAVDPGSGADQCGTAGTYYLDTICSSHHTALFWGLDGDGGGDPGTLPAPTGPDLAGTTDTTATLSWGAVSGATAYVVRRDGVRAGTTTSTSYTDTGLVPGTTYTYTVAAVDSAGAAGRLSSPVTATTTGDTPACHTASNYAHTVTGRAHQSGGHTYATGSGQAMGLWNTYTTRTLKETSPGYYVVADAGCPA
ncbi:PHB depolymerase family esterase [Streptomyces fradiae]|uniref:extracellular catalytic domain type 1 short-chain-length polyhydroxyalkanoate depolymerase n=1 Tax=Streptomyces fradiae TaxID=1906 RepID=UPI003986DC83